MIVTLIQQVSRVNRRGTGVPTRASIASGMSSPFYGSAIYSAKWAFSRATSGGVQPSGSVTAIQAST